MKKTILLLALGFLWPCSSSVAGIGKTWTTGGAEQFAEGKLEGVSVLSTGEVVLAPESEKMEGLEAEFVWDVEAGPDGTVYVGTGGPAAVYTLSGGKVQLLYKCEEKHVLSVLPLPDGSVLVGTAPQGIIFRVDRHGKASTFVDLPDSYVWDMALGPRTEIYCATGPDGRLVEMNRMGDAAERMKVKQKNLMCVTVDKNGTVYAGTDTDGYIYSVTPGGKSALVYDAEESEVHDLAVDANGVLYACTAQSEPSGPPGGPSPVRRARPSREPGGEPAMPPEAGPPGAPGAAAQFGPPGIGAPAAYNSVYRITPDQGATLIARFDRTLVLSLALAGEQVLAGTGTNGRLIAIGPDAQYSILTEFNVAHLTAMAALPEGEVIVGTANPGALHRVKKGCRKTGSLASKPFDASYLSHWGSIWWQQRAEKGQDIRIRLRTGNSGEPDEHWSEWSAWATDPAGQDLKVPMGRFGQFRAELNTRGNVGTPALLEVNASYRQANRKPVIEDLAMDGESVLRKGEPAGPARPGERMPPRPPQGAKPARAEKPAPGQKTLTWRASDPNDDELTFDLYYRGIDETEWKKIKKDLKDEPSYVWDTSRVPDGYYLLKLVARDSAVRSETEALSDEKVTAPLLIDNSPPAVVGLSSRRQPDGSYEFAGVAKDTHSRIAKIEVSHNSDDWQPVFPTDGILDSPQEPFSYHTKALEAGEHVFVFAATDSSDNTGSGKAVVRVEPPAK